MKKREKICVWIFEKTKMLYAKHFKRNTPWEIDRYDLKKYPQQSLGYELGHFLISNDYQLIPKLERHDAYHIITEYGTSVKEEIALQYFFLGNKKRSPYLFAVIIVGAILLPEHYNFYCQSYQEGKNKVPFYEWNIKDLLSTNLIEIKNRINA